MNQIDNPLCDSKKNDGEKFVGCCFTDSELEKSAERNKKTTIETAGWDIPRRELSESENIEVINNKSVVCFVRLPLAAFPRNRTGKP